jgi:hypothetical protein
MPIAVESEIEASFNVTRLSRAIKAMPDGVRKLNSDAGMEKKRMMTSNYIENLLMYTL